MTYKQIDAIAAKLREMPPADTSQQECSMQQTIKVLIKEIQLLQKRGYTIDQIADTLRHEGIDIATPTLKTYLHRNKGKTAAKTAKKTRMKTVASTQETTLADAPHAQTRSHPIATHLDVTGDSQQSMDASQAAQQA